MKTFDAWWNVIGSRNKTAESAARMAWEAGVRAEREACAKLCDERAKDKPGKLPSPQAYKDEAMLIAAKIRAR